MADPIAYEIVVGLEVHARLQTQSKLFCGDSIAYGAESEYPCQSHYIGTSGHVAEDE